MSETEKMDLESFSVGPLDSLFYIPSFLTPCEQAYFLHQVNSAPASKWKTLKNRRLQNWGGVVHEKGLIAQSCRASMVDNTNQKDSHGHGAFSFSVNHVLVNEYEPGQGIMPHQDGPLYFPIVAIVSLGSPTVMRFVPHQSSVEPREEVGVLAEELTDTRDVANSATDQGMQKEDTSAIQEDHEKPGNLRIEKCSQRTCPKDVSVILMPGSLLLFKDSAYQEYLHGIVDSVEHKVDATVVNSQVVMDGGIGRNGSYKEQGMSHGADFPGSKTLQRTGTRISLTCRLVPKVKAKFLRL